MLYLQNNIKFHHTKWPCKARKLKILTGWRMWQQLMHLVGHKKFSVTESDVYPGDRKKTEKASPTLRGVSLRSLFQSRHFHIFSRFLKPFSLTFPPYLSATSTLFSIYKDYFGLKFLTFILSWLGLSCCMPLFHVLFRRKIWDGCNSTFTSNGIIEMVMLRY